MKTRTLFCIPFLLLSFVVTYAQENETAKDSITNANTIAAEELIAVEAAVEKAKQEAKVAKEAEKARKKEEKALKKAEKEEKKKEKLADAIVEKKSDISEDQLDIIKMESEMQRDKLKGKLSPNDITKINDRIRKRKERILKNQDKLRKLERKQ